MSLKLGVDLLVYYGTTSHNSGCREDALRRLQSISKEAAEQVNVAEQLTAFSTRHCQSDQPRCSFKSLNNDSMLHRAATRVKIASIDKDASVQKKKLGFFAFS